MASNNHAKQEKNAGSKTAGKSKEDAGWAAAAVAAMHLEKKPKRPLHAYNLFYKFDRERLLAGGDKVDVPPTVADVLRLSQEHKTKPKRSHRRAEGRIPFLDLCRTIADRWKSLPDESRKIFENQAEIEKQVYEEKLKIWTQEQESVQVKAAVEKEEDAEELNLRTSSPPETDDEGGSYYSETDNIAASCKRITMAAKQQHCGDGFQRSSKDELRNDAPDERNRGNEQLDRDRKPSPTAGTCAEEKTFSITFPVLSSKRLVPTTAETPGQRHQPQYDYHLPSNSGTSTAAGDNHHHPLAAFPQLGLVPWCSNSNQKNHGIQPERRKVYSSASAATHAGAGGASSSSSWGIMDHQHETLVDSGFAAHHDDGAPPASTTATITLPSSYHRTTVTRRNSEEDSDHSMAKQASGAGYHHHHYPQQQQQQQIHQHLVNQLKHHQEQQQTQQQIHKQQNHSSAPHEQHLQQTKDGLKMPPTFLSSVAAGQQHHLQEQPWYPKQLEQEQQQQQERTEGEHNQNVVDMFSPIDPGTMDNLFDTDY